MGAASVTVVGARSVTGARRRQPNDELGSTPPMTGDAPQVTAAGHDVPRKMWHVVARKWHAGAIAGAAANPAPPLTSTFVVVGTGVDPVTSRFSGARSTN